MHLKPDAFGFNVSPDRPLPLTYISVSSENIFCSDDVLGEYFPPKFHLFIVHQVLILRSGVAIDFTENSRGKPHFSLR